MTPEARKATAFPGAYVDWQGLHGAAKAWIARIQEIPANGWWATYKGVPGDRLWIREAWNLSKPSELTLAEPHAVWARNRALRVVWRAGGPTEHPKWGKALWRPRTQMPREASRITLEILSVRVERLFDISETDAIAEGVRRTGSTFCTSDDHEFAEAVTAFYWMWDSVHEKKANHDTNPWVWRLEFRKLRKVIPR